ncbi:hypothetical protein [Dinghuibacter silviterrae]|uniref:DUF4878 domain-containing protein n=1 Tax=Dinghuibacter silviterrae TaxID=1539049 RepID=A0A4V3GLT8_9BACT|nr:hypothetical protein [Dinghuibacter silviterrae]TDX00783.1 hypothetical protein EDB95_1812 [Dinghuibacter silviterrae]
MRKYTYLLLALVAGLWSACHAPYAKPSDPTEAGRDFINATLKADYAIADGYILQDTLNQSTYRRYKQQYTSLPDAEKDSYAKASLVIYSVDKPSDSTAVIDFSNTYKNERSRVFLVRKGGEWWVDFAKMFTDTTSAK